MKIEKFVLIVFFVFIVLFSSAIAIEYNLGRGLKAGKFTLGGYIALIYGNNINNDYQKFDFEELALLGFIDITNKLKFFTELELKNIYIYSSNPSENKGFNTKQFEINRLYFDYLYNDYFKFRMGRFITPLGYWNPIYVIVLRWTTSNPITSVQFYPRFLTGIRFFGLLPFQDDSWEYDIVFQVGEQINEDNNSIIAKDFYAFQLKKYFWTNSTFGITGGYFKKKYRPEEIKFLGFNLNIKKKFYELTFEYFYSDEKENYYKGRDYARTSYYLQGVFRIFPKNYLIARTEYFKDLSDGKHIENYILGWNFRPLYPVSLKAEYKLRHNKLDIIDKYDHLILVSFSVLF